MRVRDLRAPVTAIKLDWVGASTWMGFTPRTDDIRSRNKCTSNVLRQYGNGYVIEYITVSLQKPNEGFGDDPLYIREREEHHENAGRFVAIHKLKTSSRSLIEIIGEHDYHRLQDVWAQDGKRFRWSVAFPIIETYLIKDRPLAKDLLGENLYAEFITQTALLRTIDDRVRDLLKDLEINRVEAVNEWIAVEDEIQNALRSSINKNIEAHINHDLKDALEGQTDDRRQKLRRRAAWIAERFIYSRQEADTLICDQCQFNPSFVFPGLIKPRSLLDVHHKNPLYEGIRRTTYDDFSLLCPRCHRIEHQRLKLVANGKL